MKNSRTYSQELQCQLRDLGVDTNALTPEDLREILVSRLADLHPDKTGGDFSDPQVQEDFLAIKQALDRLDKERSSFSKLVPLTEVSDLSEVLEQLRASSISQLGPQHAHTSDPYKAFTKKKYFLPKIGSAIFAALCLAMASLIGNFKQNPLYKSAFNYYAREPQHRISDWADIQIQDLGTQFMKIRSDADFARREVYKLQIYSCCSERHVQEYLRQSNETPVAEGFDGLSQKKHRQESAEELESIIRRNSITELNLFEFTDPDFLSDLKARSAQVSKTLADEADGLNPDVKQDLKGAFKYRNAVVSRETLLSLNEATINLRILLAEQTTRLTLFDHNMKAVEQTLARKKNLAITETDTSMLKRLLLATSLAWFLFALLWVRERSDERWANFLTTEQGAETVMARLHADSEIMQRIPPSFSMTEFTRVIAKKDVPRVLAPLMGLTLDITMLGNISSLLLEKLKRRSVIAERISPNLQTWFDIRT